MTVDDLLYFNVVYGDYDHHITIDFVLSNYEFTFSKNISETLICSIGVYDSYVRNKITHYTTIRKEFIENNL